MAEGNDILFRVEEAFAAYLVAQSLTGDVAGTTVNLDAERIIAGYSTGPTSNDYPSDDIEQTTVAIPRVAILAQQATPTDNQLSEQGIWEITVSVTFISSSAKGSNLEHRTGFAALVDKVLALDLATQLTASLSDFTCGTWRAGAQTQERDDNGNYMTNQDVILYQVRGSD
tara:strand:+ start:3453 stop:3965 length:513 start_codon:yes stop_codon:yes gene_type:complete